MKGRWGYGKMGKGRTKKRGSEEESSLQVEEVKLAKAIKEDNENNGKTHPAPFRSPTVP